jgi:hypothetical protein
MGRKDWSNERDYADPEIPQMKKIKNAFGLLVVGAIVFAFPARVGAVPREDDLDKGLVPLETPTTEDGKKDAADGAAPPLVTPQPTVTRSPKSLPDWIPAVPDFTPATSALKKQENGVETGTIKGTSLATPETIAEAWHIAATARKLSFGRTNSDINGKKSVRITIADVNGGSGGEAELVLEPGKNTLVELNYKTDLPASPSPSESKSEH